MKSKIYYLVLLLACCRLSYANYVSPGTGMNWTLDDLVQQSKGAVIADGGGYKFSDTVFIVATDTLRITTNTVVRFTAATYLDVNGVLIINPPSAVNFTADDPTAGFYGLRIDSSNNSVLRKLTLEHANALRLGDSHIRVDSCIFRDNSAATNLGNAAIVLFRSSPMITNCTFVNNYRAAIQGGANISNAPKIIGCLLAGNNRSNSNVPQINLGATGGATDTMKILNNTFQRASVSSGAIGILPVGSVYTLISGNTIKNNRYGIFLNGGANINALISYNVIDSNNIQNEPALGGSGINVAGGSATSHQNTIITGNLIRWNLWGITIQGRSQPNVGNLTNADTTDDGKNEFILNNNNTGSGTDLYNSTPDSIYAQNNYWGTNDTITVESRITHTPDTETLGFVTYLPFITRASLPVVIRGFSGYLSGKTASLSWMVASESNISAYVVERGSDGVEFHTVGTQNAKAGSDGSYTYRFVDEETPAGHLFYRIKIVERDGRVKYSSVIRLSAPGRDGSMVRVYPTIIRDGSFLVVDVQSVEEKTLSLKMITTSGSIAYQQTLLVHAGKNQFSIPVPPALAKGLVTVIVAGRNVDQVIRVVKQ